TMHELQTSFDSLAGWMEIHQPASPAGRVLVGAQLQIEPYDDAGYSSGIGSKDTFDLRDSHVTIEVAGTTTDSTGVESFLAAGSIPASEAETDRGIFRVDGLNRGPKQ